MENFNSFTTLQITGKIKEKGTFHPRAKSNGPEWVMVQISMEEFLRLKALFNAHTSEHQTPPPAQPKAQT